MSTVRYVDHEWRTSEASYSIIEMFTLRSIACGLKPLPRTAANVGRLFPRVASAHSRLRTGTSIAGLAQFSGRLGSALT